MTSSGLTKGLYLKQKRRPPPVVMTDYCPVFLQGGQKEEGEERQGEGE